MNAGIFRRRYAMSTARRLLLTALLGSAALVAGCTAENPRGSAAVGQATRPDVSAQAAAPAPATGARRPVPREAIEAFAHTTGERINVDTYRMLVSGNTLFRPLESGVETRIFVASDGSERMRIRAPDGAVGTDTGRQTLQGDLACRQWQKAGSGHRLCFEYYRNGRVLTMVERSGQVLPAKFLIQKGDTTGI